MNTLIALLPIFGIWALIGLFLWRFHLYAKKKYPPGDEQMSKCEKEEVMKSNKLYLKPSEMEGWFTPEEIEPNDKGGVCCFVQWSVISDHLRNIGTLKDHEMIERMEVTRHGIAVYIADRA